MSRLPFATFLPVVWKWLPLLSETLLQSKNFSSVFLNNLLLCSDVKLSCIGILARVWTRWNSLKLNPTSTIWCLNTNNTKKPLLRMKVNSMRKKRKRWLKKRLLYSKLLNADYQSYLFFLIFIIFQNLIIRTNLFSIFKLYHDETENFKHFLSSSLSTVSLNSAPFKKKIETKLLLLLKNLSNVRFFIGIQ